LGELKEAKLCGGIGSILAFGSFIPYAGLLFPIAGLILEILAVNKISHVVNDKSIFKNYIVAVVVETVGVVGAIIFGAATFILLEGSLEKFSLSLIGAILIGLIVLWITLVIAMNFMKKSFEAIATKLNVPMFKTVAKLYWIGALLSIVIVGLLVSFIGGILKIVAYFSIPEEVQPLPQLPPTPPPGS